MDEFKAYAEDRLGYGTSGGAVVKDLPPRKIVTKVEIELDERAVPIWPQQGSGEHWNLATKKNIVREFLKLHYRKLLFQISVVAWFTELSMLYRTGEQQFTCIRSLGSCFQG